MVHAPELFEPKMAKRTRVRAKFLREIVGIDPAILADELGLKEITVRTMQRKLGLRKCSNPRDTE